MLIGPASRKLKLPVAPVNTNVTLLSTFAWVPKLILPADVKTLEVGSNMPLSVMSPTVDVAVKAPPTDEAPRFKLFEVIAAEPVPRVLRVTAPVKLFVWVARLIP